MDTIEEMFSAKSHTTSKGETFNLALKKKRLSDQHNYWLYFVEAKHKDWRPMGFAVFVTKQSFPSEEQADRLARTLAIDEVEGLLEEATEEGRPLYFPVFSEGWAVH